MQEKLITVSIVSHGHGPMVSRLVDALHAQCPEVCEIIITQNIAEPPLHLDRPGVRLIENRQPKGFGANHNNAFKHSNAPFFCVLNPDITLEANPFPPLLSALKRTRAALAAPIVLTPNGELEDNLRRFPTVGSLLCKLMTGEKGRYPHRAGQSTIHPDWVAGMFMLFRRKAFQAIGGFDERYFLYYEDVDICARLWHAGLRVTATSDARVIHDAQRASHRHLRHLRWHLGSAARYLLKRNVPPRSPGSSPPRGTDPAHAPPGSADPSSRQHLSESAH